MKLHHWSSFKCYVFESKAIDYCLICALWWKFDHKEKCYSDRIFHALTEGIAINFHFWSPLGLSDNEEGIEREKSAISRGINNEAYLSICTLKLLCLINVSLMCL